MGGLSSNPPLGLFIQASLGRHLLPSSLPFKPWEPAQPGTNALPAHLGHFGGGKHRSPTHQEHQEW